MIVKTNRKYVYGLILLLLCSFFFSALIYLDSKSLTVALCCTLPLQIVCMRQWIALGKTLEFKESGITVSFLWMRKEYPWDSLKLKRFVDYRNKFGYKNTCSGGAEFSPKRIKGPKRIVSADYCMVVRPISFFFVTFQSNKPEWGQYLVDESDFRMKLNEWGVILPQQNSTGNG